MVVNYGQIMPEVSNLKKRSCKRFNIPGTTLYYRESLFFFFTGKYTADYYPVLNFSKGGAKFLCQQRLTPGRQIVIKLIVPGIDNAPEIMASVKWILKNPEQSYRYQTGISFNSYGERKSENSMEILSFLEELEASTGE